MWARWSLLSLPPRLIAATAARIITMDTEATEAIVVTGDIGVTEVIAGIAAIIIADIATVATTLTTIAVTDIMAAMHATDTAITTATIAITITHGGIIEAITPLDSTGMRPVTTAITGITGIAATIIAPVTMLAVITICIPAPW